MQIVLGGLILFLIGVAGVVYVKLVQFKHPKAAFWYYVSAYCMANGDAEMRRIERQYEHYRIMERLCGGKVEEISNDREAQNS